MFPLFTNGYRSLDPSKKHSVNLVRRWLVEWFDESSKAMPEVKEWELEAAHLSMCVPHSIRRSGVKWASECMAYEWQCLIQGRWGQNSICFRLYIQEGASVREDFVSRKLENPVFRMWMWQFGVVNTRRADVCANAARLCPRKRSRLPANR